MYENQYIFSFPSTQDNEISANRVKFCWLRPELHMLFRVFSITKHVASLLLFASRGSVTSPPNNSTLTHPACNFHLRISNTPYEIFIPEYIMCFLISCLRYAGIRARRKFEFGVKLYYKFANIKNKSIVFQYGTIICKKMDILDIYCFLQKQVFS
jgi:hypothetical protein